MSMITLNGTLVNTYTAPKRGEDGEDKDKVQIMGNFPVKGSDEVRMDLVTVTVKDARKFADMVGSEISLPVGAFSPQKGTVIFYSVTH